MSIESFISNATKRKKKSKATTEVDIEDSFVRFAKSKGCVAYKLILLNRRGFPDRTVLCPGSRILFIEFKRAGGKPTPPQQAVRKALEGLGFNYHVCNEVGQAEQVLQDFLNFL